MDSPYQPPESKLVPEPNQANELASRSERFWGALIDGMIGLVIAVGLYLPTGLWNKVMSGSLTVPDTVIIVIAGFVGFTLVHGYTLATRGQTLGKVVLKIHIVSYSYSTLLPAWKILGLRYLPTSLAASIPFIGSLVSLVDVLFIFRKDKRCIHDFIAGTKVVRNVA